MSLLADCGGWVGFVHCFCLACAQLQRWQRCDTAMGRCAAIVWMSFVWQCGNDGSDRERRDVVAARPSAASCRTVWAQIAAAFLQLLIDAGGDVNLSLHRYPRVNILSVDCDGGKPLSRPVFGAFGLHRVPGAAAGPASAGPHRHQRRGVRCGGSGVGAAQTRERDDGAARGERGPAIVTKVCRAVCCVRGIAPAVVVLAGTVVVLG